MARFRGKHHREFFLHDKLGIKMKIHSSREVRQVREEFSPPRGRANSCPIVPIFHATHS